MTTRNLTDPAVSLRRGDPEEGLVAPLYENIVTPEDFGPVDVVVDDLKIKRFAFTQDDFGDWYLRSGPEGVRIGHAALLANDLLQLFTLRYAPSQVVGLHTQEELWFDRPVPIDTVVTLRATYTETFELRGQGYVAMTAEARDSEGRTVLRHRGEEIMRTAPAEVGGRGSSGDSGQRVSAEYDETIPLVVTAADGLTAGAGLVPIAKETTLEQVAVFSRYGEGVVNIHNNVAAAKTSGLVVPIVQGQQLVCYLVELLTRVFGYYWFSGGWIKVKFLKPVDVFDRVSVGGAIRSVDETSDGRRIELEVWVTRSDGSLAAVGWARCELPALIDEHLVPAPRPAASMDREEEERP